jgi:hypothetical protein
MFRPHDEPRPEPLPIHVTEDGRVFVHVGSRYVETGFEELDRILDRVAVDGGSVLYSRDDAGDEPGPAALDVAELVAAHGVELRLLEPRPDDWTDSDL